MLMPKYIEPFIAPVRDSHSAQVAITALLLCIVLDVTIGLANAAIQHEIKSSKMRDGARHKLSELGMVVAADVIDGLLVGSLGIEATPVLISTTVYLVIMELFSVCENCIKINPEFTGVPVVGTVARLVHESKANSVTGGQGE